MTFPAWVQQVRLWVDQSYTWGLIVMEATNCNQWPSQWPPWRFQMIQGHGVFQFFHAILPMRFWVWEHEPVPLRVVFSHAIIAVGSIQYTHCWYSNTILDPTRLTDRIPILMNCNLSLTAIYSEQYTDSFWQLKSWLANPHGHNINRPISIPRMLDISRHPKFLLAKNHQFSRWIPRFWLLKTHDFSWFDPSGTQLLFIVCSIVASKDRFKLFTIIYPYFGIFFHYFFKTNLFYLFSLLQTVPF